MKYLILLKAILWEQDQRKHPKNICTDKVNGTWKVDDVETLISQRNVC